MRNTARFMAIAFMILLTSAPVRAVDGVHPPSPPAGPSGDGQSANAPAGNDAAQNPGQAGQSSAPLPPLSGVEVLTPGSTGNSSSFLLPTFEWTGYGDTNVAGTNRSQGRNYLSTYVGSLTVQDVRKTSQFNAEYSGGELLYTDPVFFPGQSQPITNSNFHTVSLSEQVSWRRWSLLLGDQGSYLPESAAGFGGFGGQGSFGLGAGAGSIANSPAFNSTLNPDQSILTGQSKRLSNTAMAQIAYTPGARSTFTVSGVYGALNFLQPGLIDINYELLFAGYNFKLTRRDEISVYYTHSLLKLHAANRNVLNRGFELAYGRQITGKLSMQFAAGPVVNQIAQPQGGAVTRSFWSTFDSLTYRVPRGSFAASFSRGLTGGSGVIPGAETDTVSTTIGRQLSRRIFSSLEFSHSYNQSLTQLTAGIRRSQYESYLGGLTLSREFGERLSVYFNYSYQQQFTNAGICTSNSCATSFVRQFGGVGINWHGRPIRL